MSLLQINLQFVLFYYLRVYMYTEGRKKIDKLEIMINSDGRGGTQRVSICCDSLSQYL